MPNQFWGAIPLLELKKGSFKLKKSLKGFAKNLTSSADLLYGTNLNQLKLVAKEKRCTECQNRGIFKQKGFYYTICGDRKCFAIDLLKNNSIVPGSV